MLGIGCMKYMHYDKHFLGTNTMRLFAGCGIVAGSDPAAELAESNAKLIPMRESLG